MLKKQFIFLLCSIITISCNQKQKQKETSGNMLRVSAKGNFVPKEKLKKPLANKITPPKSRVLGAPEITVCSLNELQSIIDSNFSSAKQPIIKVPGTDTLMLPLIKNVNPVIKKCGSPDVIVSKDPVGKDKNPYSFSTYKVLQGLKQQHIRKLMQDSKGNLWMATRGGGVIRFDGKNFAHFSEKQGLCNNFAWNVFEDSKGNLWIGTQFGGANKYDGKNFYNISDSTGLLSNAVYCFEEDKHGNILIGGEGGLSVYDGRSIKNISVKQGLPTNVIWCIHCDKKGNIWMGTNSCGLIKYDGKNISIYNEKNGFTGKSVHCIYQDENDDLYLGTDCGLIKFDGTSFKPILPVTDRQNTSIWSVVKDSQGNIWCSSLEKGVYRLKGNYYQHYDDSDGLPTSYVWDVFNDKNGNVWFGSASGLVRYNGSVFTHFTEKEGLCSTAITGIQQDNAGNMWLSTFNNGIMKFDGRTFQHYSLKQGLQNYAVNCMRIDYKDDIWIGSSGFGLSRIRGNNFELLGSQQGVMSNMIVLNLSSDKNNGMWVSGEGSLGRVTNDSCITYGTDSGLLNGINYCSLVDSKGRLWAGSPSGVLMKDEKGFTYFTKTNGLPNDVISSLVEDAEHNIWITTKEGVAMFNGNTFTYFTEKDGLSDNNVISSMLDSDGNIWFGTNNGLSKLLTKNIPLREKDPDVPVFVNFSFEDGFLGVNCRKNSLFQDKKGDIWIGAGDRLTVYHPACDQRDTVAPAMQLTGIDLFNESVDWGRLENDRDTSFTMSNGAVVHDLSFDHVSNWYNIPIMLSLPYDDNNITINYIGISLRHSGKIKYKYKLEGADKNWSVLSSNTSVNYSNLNPGEYTFIVKSISGEGIWSSPIEYHFVIRPPWWKTWWFYLFSVFFIVITIVVYFRVRTSALRKRQRELEKTVDERTSEIVKQKSEIEEHRKEILDSINYAKRIQYALLASDTLLKNNLENYFVLFKPKDIVSGDFYWAGRTNDGFILVVGDCTGHGVPGAFMSLLNISKLSQTVNENKVTRPDLILNNVRSEIIKALNPDDAETKSQDGMDAVICKFDFTNSKLDYAAANNSFYIVREGVSGQKELLTCLADKMPVGAGLNDTTSFTFNEMALKKGDMIYLLTDGYADQFGGQKGKKFKYKKLEELIITISGLDLAEQETQMNATFEDWKGELEQVDDICIIGIRV